MPIRPRPFDIRGPSVHKPASPVKEIAALVGLDDLAALGVS